MKKFCFCCKIHIPAIPRNYRFFEVGRNHQYYNDSQVCEHVKQLNANSIVPFLEMLKSLSLETGGSFQAGISISGTTLNLLKKIVPETLVKLTELAQNNCIDFLSEPWSHSIIPLIETNLLSKQINRQNELINEVFGKAPKVFMSHSPFGLLKTTAPIITKLNLGIFAYTNQITPSPSCIKELTPKLFNQKNTLFINNKISQILQKIKFDPNKHMLSPYVSKVIGQININSVPSLPTIVVYNLLQGNNPFNLTQIIVWKKMLKQLVNCSGFQYCLPFEIIDHYKNASPSVVSNVTKPNNYQSTNYWVTNKLQRETVKKQLVLNTMIQHKKSTTLLSIWNFIQDMENLFFMSDNFLNPKFAIRNYTPYTSPYMAYINYMNILDDMMLRVKGEQKRSHQLINFKFTELITS